jgi:hypothetical protein
MTLVPHYDASPALAVPAGWREWARLPQIAKRRLRAKLDTGARTSALGASDIHVEAEQVSFRVAGAAGQPLLTLPLVDQRWVTDTGGRRELRPVVRTRLELGGAAWDIELTLTARDGLKHRLLLGRSALAGRFLVDPATSYRLQGRDHESV